MSCDKSDIKPGAPEPGNAPAPDVRDVEATRAERNKSARDERLAAQLRANLKRRKASQRSRATSGPAFDAPDGAAAAPAEPGLNEAADRPSAGQNRPTLKDD